MDPQVESLANGIDRVVTKSHILERAFKISYQKSTQGDGVKTDNFVVKFF